LNPAGISQTITTGAYCEVQPGLRLHYATAGFDNSQPNNAVKPLMILLHGFPEFWAAWKDVMPLLASCYRVVAPDLRGFNLSDKPDSVKAYTPRNTVADIVGLIKALRRSSDEKIILVAHDWGGAVAWNLAAQFGHLLSHLVIINSPHPYTFWRDLRSDADQQSASDYMNWLRKPGCEVPLAQDQFKRLEDFFKLMGTSNWFDETTRQLYHQAWSQPGALQGGCNYYRASPLHPPQENDPGPLGFELDPEVFRVTVPTLVLWGLNDVALPVKLLDGIAPYINELSVQKFAGYSHWICHENPQLISDAIELWLQPQLETPGLSKTSNNEI
jgi:epoxide hydrolase 4